MRAAVWVVCAVMVVGCKKDNEGLKKQAVAIRDKALACKDAACAKAAQDEYVALTKDLEKLSKEDADFFFADIGPDISKIVLAAERAPPAAPAPVAVGAVGAAPAAKPVESAGSSRVSGNGFSLELASGWKVEKPPVPSILLAASKGDDMFGVTRANSAVGLGNDAACRKAGTKALSSVKAEGLAAGIVDGPTGKACQIEAAAGGQIYGIAIMPAPSGDPFQAMCITASKEATRGCLAMLATWKSEASTTSEVPTGTRASGPGFSFQLAAGWKSVPPDDNKLFVGATDDDERRVSVLRMSKRIGLDKQEECDSFGAELRKRLEAKEGVSKVMDTATGLACSHILLAKGFVMMFTHFKTPTGNPFQMLCVIRETDNAGAIDCGNMWKSFAFEKT